MEVVLGLSMSSHVTRLVLVEGADGRGATLEHDEFPVNHTSGWGRRVSRSTWSQSFSAPWR